VDPPRSEICNRGPDDGLFAPGPEREWDWRLLYLGRIDERKGIETAIEALALLDRRARLVIDGAGDGRHAAELEELAGRLGVESRIEFTCSPRERVPEAYAAADAVIFPVRWDEPWGLVPLEAMATGRPVVATGRGGSAEYLRDRANCLLFPPSDAAALAEALSELADDAELRARLRRGGFETAARFSERAFNEQVAHAHEREAGVRP
jgi:glycosyltransferase involved in cell wall biosynthesis